MPNPPKAIREYYDQNTRLFLVFNKARKAQNIHRSLWTDGAKTLEDALNVTNERIRAEVEALAPSHARIADLGCGVGAGLIHIIPRLNEPLPALGLTLSPIQARLAGQFARQSNLDKQILFAEGDFTSVPCAGDALDVVYSIEAIVHAQEPGNYLREASRLLRSGGKLILVDDYLANRPLSKNEAKWLITFINGWHVPGVTTVERTLEVAKKHQLHLVRNNELTPHLRLRNLPDLLAQFLRFVGDRIPIQHELLPSMLGSMALQQCLYRKVIEYRFLVFEKS